VNEGSDDIDGSWDKKSDGTTLGANDKDFVGAGDMVGLHPGHPTQELN